MKRIAQIVCILFVSALFAGTVLAGDGGNPKKGKYLWKKNCKTCHVEGGDGGVLSPSSKTQKQWNRFFEKKHEQMGDGNCKKFSENVMHDIQHYMYDHAMDSDQPETCG